MTPSSTKGDLRWDVEGTIPTAATKKNGGEKKGKKRSLHLAARASATPPNALMPPRRTY
jgi:hypothetical protein